MATWKEKFNKKYNHPKGASHSLSDISKETGVSKKGIQQIYNKGIGAYKTNPQSVRPNVTSKEQWAYARVYSSVMGGKASKVDAKELKMEMGGSTDDFNRTDFYKGYYERLSPSNFIVEKENEKITISMNDKYKGGGKIFPQQAVSFDGIDEVDAVANSMFEKGGETNFNPDGKIKDKIVHASGDAGGMLVGKRHSNGGIKALNKSTGQPLEMEGGEVVITRNAVSDNKKRSFNGKMMTNRQILSSINESGGGVSFADGGQVPNDVQFDCNAEYEYGGKTMCGKDLAYAMGGVTTAIVTDPNEAMADLQSTYGFGDVYAKGGDVKWIKNIDEEYGWNQNPYDHQGGYISEDGDYTIYQEIKLVTRDFGETYIRNGAWIVDYKDKPIGYRGSSERMYLYTLKDAKEFVSQINNQKFAKGGEVKDVKWFDSSDIVDVGVWFLEENYNKGNIFESERYDISHKDLLDKLKSGKKDSKTIDQLKDMLFANGQNYSTSLYLKGYRGEDERILGEDIYYSIPNDYAKGGLAKGYHNMPDGTIMKNSDHYAKGGEIDDIFKDVFDKGGDIVEKPKQDATIIFLNSKITDLRNKFDVKKVITSNTQKGLMLREIRKYETLLSNHKANTREKGSLFKDFNEGIKLRFANINAVRVPQSKKSNLTKEENTFVRSESFIDWFGDWELAKETDNYTGVSKVIDDKTKEPLVVYHGTDTLFTSWETYTSNNLHYFSKERKFAEFFATSWKDRTDKTAKDSAIIKNKNPFKGTYIYPCFLDIKNPIDFSVFGVDKKPIKTFIDYLKIKYDITNFDWIETNNTSYTDFKTPVYAWMIIRMWQSFNIFIKNNTPFDGFIFYEYIPDSQKNGLKDASLCYTTFNSTQNKFANAKSFNKNIDSRFNYGGKV